MKILEEENIPVTIIHLPLVIRPPFIAVHDYKIKSRLKKEVLVKIFYSDSWFSGINAEKIDHNNILAVRLLTFLSEPKKTIIGKIFDYDMYHILIVPKNSLSWTEIPRDKILSFKILEDENNAKVIKKQEK